MQPNLTEAISRLPAIEETKTYLARSVGFMDLSIGLRIYTFEVELHEFDDQKYVIVARPEHAQRSDMDLFYTNALASNQVNYQLEKFISEKLGLKVALKWQTMQRTTPQHFAFDIQRAPE